MSLHDPVMVSKSGYCSTSCTQYIHTLGLYIHVPTWCLAHYSLLDFTWALENSFKTLTPLAFLQISLSNDILHWTWNLTSQMLAVCPTKKEWRWHWPQRLHCVWLVRLHVQPRTSSERESCDDSNGVIVFKIGCEISSDRFRGLWWSQIDYSMQDSKTGRWWNKKSL